MAIVKLKVDEWTFEVGENEVKYIELSKDLGLVEIEFEKNSVWDKKIISIHNFGSIDLKEELLDIDPYSVIGGSR